MKDRKKNSHQLLWNFARSPHLSVTIGLAYQCVIFFADWYWRVLCNLGLPWPFHLRLYFMNGIKENKKTRGIKSSRVTNPWSMLQPNLNAVISIMFSVRPLSSVSYPAMSCWYWKLLMSFPNGSPRRRDLVDSENGRREKEALRMPRELFVLRNGFSLYRTRQSGRRR